jgi:hypothetical protein
MRWQVLLAFGNMNDAVVIHVQRFISPPGTLVQPECWLIAKRKSWTSLHNKRLRPGALLVASQFGTVVHHLETLARKMAEQST